MKTFFSTCLVILSLFSAGCLRDSKPEATELVRGPGETQVVTASPAQKALSKTEIADKMESAIRDAVFLKVTVTASQETTDGVDPALLISGTGPVRAVSYMTKERFKTVVSDEKGNLVRGFSLNNGVMEEFLAGRPIKTYKSPHPNGTGGPLTHSQVDCFLGNHTFTWLGVPKENSVKDLGIDRATTMRNIIDNAVQLPDSTEGQHDCYVFKRKIPLADGGEVSHLIMIDKQSFQVLRWETTQPGVRRIRTYEVETSLHVPENIDWTISGSKNRS